MYARSTSFQTDPARLPEAVALVRDEVAPALDQMAGCIGLSMITEGTRGRVVVSSAWRDEQALHDSEAQVLPLRARVTQAMDTAPTVDVWEIAVLHRLRDTGPGACLRATWTRTDPTRAERSIDSYRTAMVPLMEDLPGFCSASLFVDRATGRAVSSVTYDARTAMEGSREAANAMRRTAVEENAVEVLEIVEFDVAIARLRVPETV